jgi:pimeloyl-ACP methyl ester carboxylesterase
MHRAGTMSGAADADRVSSGLEVVRWGSGPPVVFVHGGLIGAPATWRKQRPLAERWQMVMPNRPGFGKSPPTDRTDYEAEAPLIADLLGNGAHLVGQSYGGTIALLAAAQRPEAVWSLTVCEPAAFRVAKHHAEVRQAIRLADTFFDNAASLSPSEFLRQFRDGVGSSRPTPEELPDSLLRGAELLMGERRQWEAEIPLGTLAQADFPKLVISGGHSSIFDLVCDELADRIGAQRAVIRGRGHTLPATGERLNACLRAFLSQADRRRQCRGARHSGNDQTPAMG